MGTTDCLRVTISSWRYHLTKSVDASDVGELRCQNVDVADGTFTGMGNLSTSCGVLVFYEI